MKRMRKWRLLLRWGAGLNAGLLCTCLLSLATTAVRATDDADEFKVKREAVFEFATKPVLRRNGDQVEIRFTTKSRCDVTVCVEDPNGRIVRHLASGVLGPRAPEPLQKDTLEQVLTWDGKDDQGHYVDNKPNHKIRVSLGLQAHLERVLNWDPKRRMGRQAPVLQTVPEGVLVYDGGGSLDFIKLYNHEGDYVRTVYPFPASKIEKVAGLQTRTSMQDGATVPVKPTFLQNTFLTSGNNFGYDPDKKYRYEAQSVNGDSHYGMYGNASTFMAAGSGRVIIGDEYLNRMGLDGSSAGMNIYGPRCALITKSAGKDVSVPPRSAALSPDGRTLYLTGYSFCFYGRASNDIVTSGAWDAFHCVLKMKTDGDAPPELFAGKLELGKPGTADGEFKVPISIAVDAKGRVYVADYMNDRVQVFDESGKFLRKLSVKRPAQICLPPNSTDLYVFSWMIHNQFTFKNPEDVAPKLSRFDLESFKPTGYWDLPGEYSGGKAIYLYSGTGVPCQGAVDVSTNPPTAWLAREWTRENVMTRGNIKHDNIRLYKLGDKKLELKRDFMEEIKKTLPRLTAARYGRMRLYCNEASGKLYVAEGETYEGKAFKELVELDPETGAFKLVPVPFDAEDMCFDLDGLIYLRTLTAVARYDIQSWREVAWDYGDEMKKVATESGSARKEASLVSGLPLPSNGEWHHGGMYVSTKGYLVVSMAYNSSPEKRTDEKNVAGASAKKLNLTVFAGRNMETRAGTTLINVYDRKGKPIATDVAPGMFDLYGVGMDAYDKLYVLTSGSRVLNGKRYPNFLTGTITKLDPDKARALTDGEKGVPVPLPDAEKPKREPDIQHNDRSQWLEGASWMYGGVGFMGKNAGVGCGCHNTRFSLDYFGRSFAPEVEHYKVAILDSAGNLIMRIGRYGNADSAGAKSLEPLGGDEVGVMHGAYVATHTDKRLFIADPSNDRILSVKLSYREDERTAIPADPSDQK